MYVILILRKEKYILVRIDLYFGGSGEKLVYFKEFGEQRQNTFREPSQLFSGIWGDQCIIFRDQGRTDPPPPPPGTGQLVPKSTRTLVNSHPFLVNSYLSQLVPKSTRTLVYL